MSVYIDPTHRPPNRTQAPEPSPALLRALENARAAVQALDPSVEDFAADLQLDIVWMKNAHVIRVGDETRFSLLSCCDMPVSFDAVGLAHLLFRWSFFRVVRHDSLTTAGTLIDRTRASLPLWTGAITAEVKQ